MPILYGVRNDRPLPEASAALPSVGKPFIRVRALLSGKRHEYRPVNNQDLPQEQ